MASVIPEYNYDIRLLRRLADTADTSSSATAIKRMKGSHLLRQLADTVAKGKGRRGKLALK